MRTFKLFCALVALLILPQMATPSLASTEVSASETREVLIKKIADQKGDALVEKMSNSKMAKKMAKFAKFFSKDGGKIDFQSEPDKWLWYGVFGLIGGILFYGIGYAVYPLWFLGYLLWLAGVICIIIWFLKKSGNM
jgi:hypothetical protein